MIQDHSFFLKGNHIGILLIHGLTGTPNEVRGIARQFNQAGYSVYGVQLAGHCGDIDDLIKTNWQDWYASVCTAARALRQETTQIFVAGLSMGALLALKYASEHHVNGVISYSPTFKYNGWSVPTWSKLIGPVGLPIVSKINRFKHTTFDEAEPYGIKNKSLRDRIVNAMNSDDSSVAGLLMAILGIHFMNYKNYLVMYASIFVKLRHLVSVCMLLMMILHIVKTLK